MQWTYFSSRNPDLQAPYMRNIFTILVLIGLTIGAVFLFRLSLRETLIEIDIEELARHSQEEKEKKTIVSNRTFPTIDDTKVVTKTPPPVSEEVAPTFDDDILPEIEKEVITPPPLKKELSLVANGTLTVPGVVAATNAERVSRGAVSLTLNTKLSAAAAAKLQDMFAQQYFEHVGPDGTQPSDWVDNAGYAYKLTGENLALGDFSGDTDLVTAWMNSPGHRANILKAEFTDIGVAVGKGMFDGKETWLAVQVFGRPMPNCAPVDADLKIEISENQNLLEAMNANLLKEQELIAQSEQTVGPEYKEKIDAYNTLVAEYNNLIGKTEALVERYNVHVQSYNTCMAQ